MGSSLFETALSYTHPSETSSGAGLPSLLPSLSALLQISCSMCVATTCVTSQLSLSVTVAPSVAAQVVLRRRTHQGRSNGMSSRRKFNKFKRAEMADGTLPACEASFFWSFWPAAPASRSITKVKPWDVQQMT